MSNATEHTPGTAPDSAAATDAPATDTPVAPNGLADLSPEARQLIYRWAREGTDDETADEFMTALQAASPEQVRTIVRDEVGEALTSHPTNDDLADALKSHPTNDDLADALKNHPTNDDLSNHPTHDDVRTIVGEALEPYATKEEVRAIVREEIQWSVPPLVSAEVNKALSNHPTHKEFDAHFEKVDERFENVATKADLLDAINGVTWKLIRFTTAWSLGLIGLIFAVARFV